MKLGGEATCPHCKYKEERDVDIHQIFTCGKCGRQYHCYVRIQVITLPLGGSEKEHKSIEVVGRISDRAI